MVYLSAQFSKYITDIKVNDGRKSVILNLIKFFRAYSALKPCSNGLVIWHIFPDNMHIEVNNGRKSATLNVIEFRFSIISTICQHNRLIVYIVLLILSRKLLSPNVWYEGLQLFECKSFLNHSQSRQNNKT